MLQLSTHLIGLLIQLLYLNLTRPNVPLQFLYLVVQHELEFFKLLSFLLKVVDTLVFLCDCCFTFLDFLLLRLYLPTHHLDLLCDLSHLCLTLVDRLDQSLFFQLSLVMLLHGLLQLHFMTHTCFNDTTQFLLRLIFDTVNGFEGFIIKLFSFAQVLRPQSLFLYEKLFRFFLFILHLQSVLSIYLPKDVSMMGLELHDSITKLLSLFLQRRVELLVPLTVSFLLICIVLGPPFHLESMLLMYLC